MRSKKVVSSLLVCSAVLISAGAFYAQTHFYNQTSAEEQTAVVADSGQAVQAESSSVVVETPINEVNNSTEASPVVVPEASSASSSNPVVETPTENTTSDSAITETTDSTTPPASSTTDSTTMPETSTSDSVESTESSETTETSSTADSSETTQTSDSSTTDSTTSSNQEVPTENSQPSTPVVEQPTTATPEEQQVIQEVQPPQTTATVESNYNYSVSANKTTSEFIEAIGADAQDIAWNNDLYASVMIAQAILETGSGNSRLSSEPNYNLFGIKGSYNGESVSFNTQEDDGSGNLYTIQAGFRKYPSYRESLEDYAELLKGGISGNSSFYSKTWKSNASSYQEVTAFLTGRYATDTNYNLKLNALIEAYNLTDYDQEPQEDTETTESEILVESNSASISANSRVNSSKSSTSSKSTTRRSNSATSAASDILASTEANEESSQSLLQSPASKILGSLSPWNKLDQ